MKLILSIVILVVAAAALWFAFAENGPAPAPPEHLAATDREPPTAPPTLPPTGTASADVPPPTDDSGRRSVAAGAASHAEAEQGVRGRVVLTNGSPLAGVAVYLLPS